MRARSETAAFDRGVTPLLDVVLADNREAVLKFRADPRLKARIGELAEKSNEGELTELERAEYAGYVRANKFVAILKRKARELASAGA